MAKLSGWAEHYQKIRFGNAAGLHPQADRHAWLPEEEDGPDLDLFFWLGDADASHADD